MYLIYYAIATILILAKGNKQAKRYFGLIQFINLVTIWNPLFSNLIAKYFTSSAIFWRVLWLLPIEFAIAYAITLLIEKAQNKKVKLAILVISLGILILSGNFIYQGKPIENFENMPNYIVAQTNYIVEQGKQKDEIVVLAEPEPSHNTNMRQISSKIKLIYSRDLYIDKIKDKEEIEKRIHLNQMYFGNYVYEAEELKKILAECKVDWIIVNTQNEALKNYLSQADLQEDCQIEGYVLYRVLREEKRISNTNLP